MRAIVLDGELQDIVAPFEDNSNMNTLHTSNNQYASGPAYMYVSSARPPMNNAQDSRPSYNGTTQNIYKDGKIYTIQTNQNPPQRQQQRVNYQHHQTINHHQTAFNSFINTNVVKHPVMQQPNGIQTFRYQQPSVTQRFPVVYSNNNNNCHNGFQGNATSTLHYHGQQTAFTQSPNIKSTEIVKLLNPSEKQTSPVLMQQVILQNEPSNSSTYHPVILTTVAQPANSNTQNTVYIVNRTQRHVSPVRARVCRNPAIPVQKSDATNAMLSISVTHPSSSLLASQPCVSSVATPFAVPRNKEQEQKQKPCNPPATSQSSLDIFSYLNSPMPPKQHAEDCDTATPDPLEFCLYDGERLRQEKEHRKIRISENLCSEEMNTSQNCPSSKTILCNPTTDETNVQSIASLSCDTSSSAGTSPCDSPHDEIANIPDNATPVTVQQRTSPGIEGSDNIIHAQSSTSPSAKGKIIINDDPVIFVGICDVPPVREESSDFIHNHLSEESAVEEDDECMPMIIACYSLNPDANDKTSKDSPNENQPETSFENNTRKISDDKTTSGRSPPAKITFPSKETRKRTKNTLIKFLDHIPKSKILRKTNPESEKDTMDDIKQTIAKAKASIEEAQNEQAASLVTCAFNTPVEDVPRKRRTTHSSSPKQNLSPVKKNNLMSSEKMKESYTGCVTSTDVIQEKDSSSTQDNATSSGIVDIGSLSISRDTSGKLSSWINTTQRKLPSKEESSCNNVAPVQTQDAPSSTRESLKPSKSSENQADDISPFKTNSRSLLKSSQSTSSKPPVCLVNPSRIIGSLHDRLDNLVTRYGEVIEELNKDITCVEVADSVKILSNTTDVPKKDVDDLQPLDLTVRKRIPSAIDEREAGSSTTTGTSSPTSTEATYTEASSRLHEIYSGALKDSSKSDPRETLSAPRMNPSSSTAGSAGLSTTTEIIITVDKAKSAATAVKSSPSKSSTSPLQCQASVASTLDNPYRTGKAQNVSSQTKTSSSIDSRQKSSSSLFTVASNHSSPDLATSSNNRKDAKQFSTVELKRVSRDTLVSYSNMTQGYPATKLATDISKHTNRTHKLPLTRKPTDPRRKKVQPEMMKWNRPMPISFLPEKKRTDVLGFSDSHDAVSTGHSLKNLEQRIWKRGILSRFPLSLVPKMIPMEQVSFEEETPSLDPRIVLNKETPPSPDAASAPTSNTVGKIKASKSPQSKMHPPKSVVGGSCLKMINILSVKDFRKKDEDIFHSKKKQNSPSLNSPPTSTVKKRPRKNLNQLVEDIHKLKTGYRIGEIKSGSNVLGGKLMGIVMTDKSSRISEFVDKEKSSEVGEKPTAIVIQVMNQPGHQDAGSEAETIQGKTKDQKVPTYSGESYPVVMEADASMSGDPGKKSDAATLPGDAIKSSDSEVKEEVREEIEEVKEVAVDSQRSTKDSQVESNSLELANKYLPVIEDSQSSLEAQEACCDEYDHMCMQGIEDSQLGSQSSSKERENNDSVEMIFPFQEEKSRKQNEDTPADHEDPPEELLPQIVGDSTGTTSAKDSELVTVTETQEKIDEVEKEVTEPLDHSKINNFFTKCHVTCTKENEPQETSKSKVASQATKEDAPLAKEMTESNETLNGKVTAKEQNNRFPIPRIKIKKEYCEDASLTPRKTRKRPIESYFIKKERSEDKKTGYSPTGSVECSETSRKRRKLVKKNDKKNGREHKKRQKSSYILLSDSSESSEDLETRVNFLSKLKEAFERTGEINEDVRKRKLQHKNSNNSNNSFQEYDGNLHDLEDLERNTFPANDEEVTREACNLKKDSQSPKEMEIENDIDIQEAGNRSKKLAESGELKETVAPDVHRIQEDIPLNKSTSDECLEEKRSEKMGSQPEHWKKKMNRRSKDEECSSSRRRNARMMGRWSKTEIPKIQPQNLHSIANVQEQDTHKPMMGQAVYLTMQKLINSNLLMDTTGISKSNMMNKSIISGETQTSTPDFTATNSTKLPHNSQCSGGGGPIYQKNKAPTDLKLQVTEQVLVKSPEEPVKTQCCADVVEESTLEERTTELQVSSRVKKIRGVKRGRVEEESHSKKKTKTESKDAQAPSTTEQMETQSKGLVRRAASARVYKQITSTTSRSNLHRRPPIRLTGKIIHKYGCNVVWKTRDRVKLRECIVHLRRIDE